MICPNCKSEFSNSNQIFKDVFTRGNSDPDIQLDILGNMNQAMTLAKCSSSPKKNRQVNDLLVNSLRCKELRMLRATTLNHNTTHLSNIEQKDQSLVTIVRNVVIAKICLAAIVKQNLFCL